MQGGIYMEVISQDTVCPALVCYRCETTGGYCFLHLQPSENLVYLLKPLTHTGEWVGREGGQE